jgi:flagellar motor switch protein FliN/FliY
MQPQMSAVDFLCKEFCEALGSVFQQTAGEPYPLAKSDIPPPVDSSGDLSYVLELKGKVSGQLFVQVNSQSAAILATRLMGDPVDESVSFLPEHEDALSEIVSQTAGGMATSLRTRFGTAEISVERKPGTASASSVTIMLKPAKGTDPVSIELFADQALFDSITASLSGSAQSSPSSLPNPAVASPVHDASAEQQNLQLVMDVELDLTLRFGQRTLMLSEVADLTTGSVVELDRVVDEPVELLLGERVIARGEVVIVDGHYGLRITELTSIDQKSFSA